MSSSPTNAQTDSQTRQMVEDELQWVPQLDATGIGVGVTEGVVVLSGEVDSNVSRHLAAKAALRVRGVRSVANEITIKTAWSTVTDVDIAEAVQNTLSWTSGLPDGAISAEVENGTVILSGSVAWESQRRGAEQQVRKITGVSWVDNRITLLPRVSAEDTHDRIQDALKRNALTDADNITVLVNGTDVTLIGRVGSYDEKRQAELTAWSSPHVGSVDNNLIVTAR